MSLLSSATTTTTTTAKSLLASKKSTMINGDSSKLYKRLDESELTPAMFVEYRRLQHELQCQEALLVLMQKLKTNQRLVSQTASNGVKQRGTATKLNQQSTNNDGKGSLMATKQLQALPTVRIQLEQLLLFSIADVYFMFVMCFILFCFRLF
jgi:hypothetical protein